MYNVDIQFSAMSNGMWTDSETDQIRLLRKAFLTFAMMKNMIKVHHDRNSSQYICFSDNGEFAYTAFIAELGEMAQRLNAVICGILQHPVPLKENMTVGTRCQN